MCGLVGAVIGAVSTIAQGVASYNAAQSAANAAEAEAANQRQQYLNNAALARAEAEAAGQQGFNEEQKLRENARRVAASQRAGFSASGLVLDSGSPLAVGADTAFQSERDAAALREGYQRRRLALENEAANYRWNADEAQRLGAFKASSLRQQGRGQLFGSLLGSASLVAGKWGDLANKFSGGGYSTRSMTRAAESAWK